jgi:outer membrane protein
VAERFAAPAALFGGVALLAASACLARDEPLWEGGLGVAGLSFPDYRGSDQSHAYALPAPYVVYRGDALRADRNGLRGMLFNSDRVDVNLSIGASLPVHSSENRAREGMPDLKPSIEAGPSFEFTLARADDRRWNLDLRLPVRFAVSLERDPQFVGTQFYPHLNVDVHDPLGFGGWNLGVLAGPVYTDSRYNRYYYSVPAAYATPDRPAYEARGGFGGTEFIVALSKRFPKFFLGGFFRADSLRGAKYEDSPLIKSRSYIAGGIAISWILGASEKRVPVDVYGEPPR